MDAICRDREPASSNRTRRSGGRARRAAERGYRNRGTQRAGASLDRNGEGVHGDVAVGVDVQRADCAGCTESNAADTRRGVAVGVGDSNAGAGCDGSPTNPDRQREDVTIDVGGDEDTTTGTGDRPTRDACRLSSRGVDDNDLGPDGNETATALEGNPEDVLFVVAAHSDLVGDTRASGDVGAAGDHSLDIAVDCDDQYRCAYGNEAALDGAGDPDNVQTFVGRHVDVVPGDDRDVGLHAGDRAA